MTESILVIAPHPDDEVLGCGGTLRKHSDRGSRVFLCVVTSAYVPDWAEEFVRKRPMEVARARAVLGIPEVCFLDFPTVKLDTVPQKDLNEAVSNVIKQVQPDVLYVPHRGDINGDHRRTHEAALVAARPVPGQCVQKILAYETLSETEWGCETFRPNVYEDISKTLASKLEAMRAYESELRQFPHPRSLEGIEVLARNRGSEAGLRAAEAFMLIRSINT